LSNAIKNSRPVYNGIINTVANNKTQGVQKLRQKSTAIFVKCSNQEVTVILVTSFVKRFAVFSTTEMIDCFPAFG